MSVQARILSLLGTDVLLMLPLSQQVPAGEAGAGHDACWINDIAPTAMIMCPCVDGLSHNEAEEISKEWAQAGTDVLLHAVLNTAIIQ